MAVHGEGGSNIENAEFGPSFKGGLSALEDDDNEHYTQRSNFENDFNNSQKSPVKRQSTTDAHIYAVPPQHGVRNNLTAAFTTLEGN